MAVTTNQIRKRSGKYHNETRDGEGLTVKFPEGFSGKNRAERRKKVKKNA